MAKSKTSSRAAKEISKKENDACITKMPVPGSSKAKKRACDSSSSGTVPDPSKESLRTYMDIPQGAQVQKKDKARKAPAGKKPAKEQKSRLISKVSPDACFILLGGKSILSLPELAFELEDMADEIFFHHVNDSKNDFANWIRDIIDDKCLAEKLFKLKTKREVQLEILKHLVRNVE